MDPSRDAPVHAEPRAALRLFLTSASVLFTELLLLRWIPAMVTYVGFFANFLLIGCFLGMGCGILLGRRSWKPAVSPFSVLLFLVVLLVSRSQLNVQVRTDEEIFFALRESHAADVDFVVLPCLVALATLVLAALSLPLGPLLRAMPPLKAYAVDIVGSLAGIAGFTALSVAGTAPWVWFVVLCAILLALWLAGDRRLRVWSLVSAVLLAGTVALSLDTGRGGQTSVWSPYYRVSFDAREEHKHLSVNGIPHQSMWLIEAILGRGSPYEQIYLWFPERHYDRVLIVGAGSGTDVAMALAKGAKHVDAVEIDPVLARLGRLYHPDHPYQDPRVALHIDDGRSFLTKSRERYDLIIFALPDSLTLASAMADVRLESFLFTREAFESARDHLAPGGVFALYNFYRERWLIERIAGMLQETFARAPIVRVRQDAMAVLAVGSTIPPAPAVAPPGEVPTDDHPFLYLRHARVPGIYLAALACVLAFAVAAVAGAGRVAGIGVRSLSLHFFALGAAFMLLETRSLVTFSLLFGTTWLVNSLAFFAILTSVLAAILVNALVRLRPGPLYLGLAASLALAWAIPPERLLVDPLGLRYALASALAFSPIFFANLIFTHSFRDSASADVAFASNLLGAALGGALEYLALASGYRALAFVVLAFYVLAFASYRREAGPARAS